MPDENLPVNTSSPTTADADKTLSLMGGVAQSGGIAEDDFELHSMKPGSKLLNQGTLLIVLVFIVAAGTLYAMRASQGEISSDDSAKQIEERIEAALAKLANPQAMPDKDPLKKENLNELFENVDEVVDTFEANVTNHQIPIEFVKKNPFLLPVYRSTEPEVKEETKEPEVDPQIAIRERLSKEVGELKVQSIMQGVRPVAIINGEFVQPGETIGSFTVADISQFSVNLVAEGESFTLVMEE